MEFYVPFHKKGMSSETHGLSLHHFSRWAHCTTNQNKWKDPPFFLMAKSVNPLFQWPFSSSRTVNVLPGRVKYPASEHLLGSGASGDQAVAAGDDGAASPSRGERRIFGGSYMILVHCMVKISLS
jgi:hypothetical protein